MGTPWKLLGAVVLAALTGCEDHPGSPFGGVVDDLAADASIDVGAGFDSGPEGPAPDSDGGAGPDGAADGGGGAGGAPQEPHGCSDLFSQDVLRAYSVQIDPAEWAKLQHEFLAADTSGASLDHPYHPCTFQLGAEIRTDAAIRLKGQSSWSETVMLDANPKAQFVIAFDMVNTKASFHGVTKLVFDMPRMDPTFLRERMAQALLRDLGLPGLCASSGKLFINGAYYGLYATEEKWGGRSLKRVFPGAADGDLWKGGTLEERPDQSYARKRAFWDAAGSITEMARTIDLQQAVTQWAAEVVLNDADGYYGGEHNFFSYDHPQRGFLWLSTDLDATYDWTTVTQHPLFWWTSRSGRFKPGEHYMTVLGDRTWRAKLVDAIAAILDRTDVSVQQKRVDAWAAQIREAVAADPHRIVDMAEHDEAIGELRDSIARRHEFLRNFIECQRTGKGTDADGDGVPWCNDCNDHAAGSGCP